jgi:CBS domain-containing protein
MNHARVDAVPVVDTTGKLRGLVTAGDVVHAVSQHGLHASSERSISTANPA